MPRTGGAGGGGGAIHYLSGITFSFFLYAKLDPSIWDAIPQVPKYSRGTLNIIASQILKTIASSIKDESLKAELNKLGSAIYNTGAQAMDYDDDRWICGNNIIPFPFPHFGSSEFVFDPSELELNPQPLPPRWKYYSALISIVADSIEDRNIASALTELGNKLSSGEE